MKRTIHFKNVLIMSFLATTVAVIVAMIIFAVTSVKTFQDQTRRSSETLLAFYAGELEANAIDLKNIIQGIYSSYSSFNTLSSGNYTNNERILLDNQLRTYINGSVRYDSIITIFTEDNSVSIWQVGSAFNKNMFRENYEIEKAVEKYICSLPASELWKWTLFCKDESVFLVLPYKRNDLYIAACIDLTKFSAKDREFNQAGNYKIAFYDESRILTNEAVFKNYGISLDTINRNKPNFFKDMRYIMQVCDIENIPVSIASIMPVSRYISEYRPYLLLMIVVFIILAVLVISVFETLMKIFVYPIDRISEVSQILSDSNEISAFLEEDSNSNIEEINHINDALAKLVNQKITLARESESRKMEKEHAQLQYFQLQTKSHFFINCLKSLYNMLEMGEYDKMRRMIMNFSDHIRFIFHDNLSLITLKDELDEVNDYANIIQIDSSSPIFMIQKVPETLYNCMVPPLVIQTFLENAVKYNAQYRKMLRFIIECELTENEDKQYLRIKLSDNGTGYEDDMLEKLNFDADSSYEQYHVGISNLKRRMQILYHNDCNLAFFNSPEDGGAVIMIYIPVIYSKDEVLSK